jgi:hypothetical protein
MAWGQADRYQAVNVRRVSFILAGLLLGSGLAASARVGVDSRQGFPLIPGTQWVYRGFVRTFDEDELMGKVTNVTWTMSVVRAVERDGLFAALVRGFPADLNWSDGQAEPQLSLLIRTDDGKFYLNSEWNTQPVLDRLDDPKYSLQGLLAADDWILELPLAAGKKFCDEREMRRDDGEYCWVTGAPHPVALSNVTGIAPGSRTAYDVAYTTHPDETVFEFVDGVGITRYQYRHHGSVAETVLRLVEFHPAPELASR